MAYGFNDDKSKYHIHVKPEVLASFRYDSSTETASAFWGRMYAKASELFQTYGENLKLRIRHSIDNHTILYMRNYTDGDIDRFHFTGIYNLTPSPTGTGYNDLMTRETWEVYLTPSSGDATYTQFIEYMKCDGSSNNIGTNRLTVTKLGNTVNNGNIIFDFDFIA